MESRLVVTIDGRGATSGSRQVNSAIDSVRSNARGMVTEVDGSFNRLRRSLFSIQGAIASLGIGEFVRRSIRSFAEFETGLVGVGKTTGMAGQELEELGKRIIALSKSTPVARNQLLDIAQAAGQLGISGNDNILKFTDTIAKMGVATDLVGDEAAVTMARILSITGEAVQSVDKLGSTLVFLGNASSATEAEIARMTIELAKATAQFNVSSANLAGLGTALKEFGQQPELARSSILRTFLTLKSATDEGGQKLRILGKLAGQTGEQFAQGFGKDAFGAFMKFIEGLRGVIEQGGNAEKVLEALGLNGTEINAVLPLLAVRFDTLKQRVKEANEAYTENTALNKEAAVAFTTLDSKLTVLKNNVQDATRRIGAQLAPALSTLADKLIVFANSGFADAIGAGLGAALQVIADNIGLITAALSVLAAGKLLSIFINLSKGALSLATNLRLGALEAIAQASGLTRAQAAANLYVTGATAVATSSRNVSLWTRAAAIGTFALNTALGLVGLNLATVSGVFSRLGAVMSSAGGLLLRVGSSIGAAVAPFLTMSTVTAAAGIAVRGLAAAFGILLSPIGIVVAAITGLVLLFQSYKDEVVQIGELNASVGNILQAIWNVTLTRIRETIAGWVEGVKQAYNGLSSYISDLWQRITQAIGGYIDSAISFVSEGVAAIAERFNFLPEPVVAVFSSIYESIRGFFEQIVTFISEKIDAILGFFRKLKEEAMSLFNDIKQGLSDAVDSIPNLLGKDVVKEANRLQQQSSPASKAQEAVKGGKVSDTPFGPALPAPPKRNVSLTEINGLLGGKGSGKTGGGGFTDPAIQKQERLKQLIEETLTPQERYNRAIEELNSLQPKSAEGVEAVRRKMAELTQELRDQDPVWRENQRLAEQFKGDFENTFKRGLESVFRKGKDGFKDMMSGFKDMYFNILTEITARPILEALLGQKETIFGGRSGGILSDIFGQIAGDSGGGGIFGQILGKPANDNKPGGPFSTIFVPDYGKKLGEDMAGQFAKDSAGSTGFLGKLGSIFSSSGEGGGFLSGIQGIFQSFSSGIGGIFSQLGGALGGLFGFGGGGGGGGFGSILSLAGSFIGNSILPGFGSIIGSVFGGFFADGGKVRAGVPIVVGERGPELFTPSVNGEIIPHEKVRRMMAVNDNIAGFMADGGRVLAGNRYVTGERGRELFVPDELPRFSGTQENQQPQQESPVVIHMNISTPDAQTFRRSQGQIMTEAALAIKKARRNM